MAFTCNAIVYKKQISARYWPKCHRPAKFITDNGRPVCGIHLRALLRDHPKMAYKPYAALKNYLVTVEIKPQHARPDPGMDVWAKSKSDAIKQARSRHDADIIFTRHDGPRVYRATEK